MCRIDPSLMLPESTSLVYDTAPLATSAPAAPRVQISKTDEATLALALSGAWTMRGHLPAAGELTAQLDAAPSVRRITFDTRELAGWDSLWALGKIKSRPGRAIPRRIPGYLSGR